MFQNLQQWLDYISHLHPQEMELGLERIMAVARPLGWQQFSCPVVTVGGTNGKGSCVKFLESIFTAAGYRTGVFTSPHLMTFHERIRVNNQMVTDQDLINALDTVEKHRQGYSLSFFEFFLLAALQIFQRSSLDLLILEVGLGGRLDAVNIVDADVAVITTIDLDHTEWLGSTRAAIAAEKAGIFRRQKPVVCGDPDPPANLRERAMALNSPWYGLNSEFHYHSTGAGQCWQWWTKMATSRVDLPPITLKHQNAATSLMVVELLQEQRPVSESAIHAGLESAYLPGRFEKISLDSKNCYLDVAHNPQGGRWLAEQWRQLPFPASRKRVAVVGMLVDKDIAGTLHPLLNYIDEWYLATLSVSRGAAAEQISVELKKMGVESHRHFSTVTGALEAALAGVADQDSVLIFGSFYTVAAARQYLLLRSNI